RHVRDEQDVRCRRPKPKLGSFDPMSETASTTAASAGSPAQLNEYEHMFLFGAAAVQDQQGTLKIVRDMIEKHGGQILVLKKWDERRLAYEVEGQKRGLYVIAYFKAPGTTISPLERD